MKYPEEIDKECVKLCDAINLYDPDFYTTESCCGHEKHPFRIFLHVKKLDRLPRILYFFDA